MSIQYELSAVEILRFLGYDQPAGGRGEKGLALPAVYREFMALAVDCPLLGTSNLWVGKMAHRMECLPRTLYETLREEIDDRAGRWKKPMPKFEKELFALSQLPEEQWTETVENYLLIGSDYAGGMGEFGIRAQDLQQDDPPVYWHRGGDSWTKWKLENEALSDFLCGVVVDALACAQYDTAEKALEEKGWRYEEYFDPKKEDWVASKAVLKKQGILYASLRRYKIDGGRAFCCCDPEKNVLYSGVVEGGEIDLSAINRTDAERIFLDIDDFPDTEG